MATYNIPLSDGTTVSREFDTDEEAVAEQQRLNAELSEQFRPTGSAMGDFMQGIEAGGGDILDVAGEFASAANRSAMQGLDFLGPGSVNPWLEAAGMPQLPTFEGAYEQTPGAEGGFMEPGTGRDVVRGAGGAFPAVAGGFPVAGRNVATPAGAVAELVGLGTTGPGPGAAGRLAFTGGQAGDTPMLASSIPPGQEIAPLNPRDLMPQSAARREAGRLIDEGSDSVRRAGMRRDPYTGRVVDDPAAMETARQGIPEGIVSTIQSATEQTKSKLGDMLDIVEQSKDSARYSVTNRPLDVAGESLGTRFQVIDDVNRRAGSLLDEEAKNLRGERVDVSGAFDEFNQAMDSMGISISRDEDGALRVIDEGSDIMGLSGPRAALERLIQRIEGVENPDAYDLHRIKRYIDENVSYGKSGEGLSGQVVNIIKRLRRGIDNALDTEFPRYNRVNTEYAETREVLDEVRRLVGSGSGQESVNFEKGLGTLLRRTLSNARSREPMLDLVSQMDNMAQRYSRSGGTQLVPYRATEGALSVGSRELDDDILTQVLFADELDRVFGTNARTSLLGDTTKAAERGAEAIGRLSSQNVLETMMEGGRWAMDRVRGINEENAMEALKELLGR